MDCSLRDQVLGVQSISFQRVFVTDRISTTDELVGGIFLIMKVVSFRAY